MNDFTKDELQFLKEGVREHYKNNKPVKGSTYVNGWAEMIKKLQSMIDNSCEHTKLSSVMYGTCFDCGKKVL